MNAKELGAEPAAPTAPTYTDNGYGTQVIQEYGTPGMTKREAIAMHAPEMHPSFDWKDEDVNAEIAEAHDAEQAALPKDPDQRKECEDWRRDPCYDLPEGPEYKAFEEAVHARVKAQTRRAKEYPVRVRAAWARAYADALLEELAK